MRFYIYIILHLCYDSVMNYIELTKLDMDMQRKLLRRYQSQLNRLPSYNMICKSSRGKKYYYITDPASSAQRYVSMEEQALIGSIKLRHFLEAAAKILESNISRQEKMLKGYRPYDLDSINERLPAVYKIEQTCKDNAESKDKLTHRTSFGLHVRSKSEALIAEALHAEGIPFQYELPLWLRSDKPVLLRPDFTIMTPSPVYWEHMGMVGNADYLSSALKKPRLYCSNGITIPDKLIVTMDTADGAIDMVNIKRIIQTLPIMGVEIEEF